MAAVGNVGEEEDDRRRRPKHRPPVDWVGPILQASICVSIGIGDPLVYSTENSPQALKKIADVVPSLHGLNPIFGEVPFFIGHRCSQLFVNGPAQEHELFILFLHLFFLGLFSYLARFLNIVSKL